ncbi:MAG: hydrogenase iron-sulfur subunit [Terriglobales bacterium]
MADEQKNVAVFICEGCEIGSALDVDALKKTATEERRISVCRSHPFLCGDEGVAQIKEGIQSGAGAVVIAACSGRFHSRTFSFASCHVERVNLRELVVWSHEPDNEDTQMLADDNLRMGIARALRTEIREPAKIAAERSILVVGGGPSGMAAAREASLAGYRVVLVEKQAELGGWLRNSKRQFPKTHPYTSLESIDLNSQIVQLEKDPNIDIYRSADIKNIGGQPGQFDVELESNGTTIRARVGAVVQATGWKPYDASRLGHLGYGQSPDVITNVEMERLVATGQIRCPSDGRPARRIAFVQCAGSRDTAHLPYCSAVCCRVSLKQALWARELDKEVEVYIFYKDIRTPAQYEDFYRRAQEDPGISMTKGDVISVTTPEAGSAQALRVNVENTLLGASIQVEADLVVLATGMVPVAADGELIRKIRDAELIVEKGQAGPQLDAALHLVTDHGQHEGTDLLHLSYRQGPDLPVLPSGFPDSHFICFPYETRRTGIYTAGCMRAPNDIESCIADAEGAVLKAIQCVELASRGAALHPRWEDLSFPDFHMQRCTQCKRCTEECPFGSLDEDEKGTPLPNPGRCRRCGICLGACPERIISFGDYSIDIVSSMIKAVNIPDEFEEKPRLLILACENDAVPALEAAGIARLRYSPFVRIIPVRCLGAVNVIWIADALARGFDGILLLGCKSGDDYQCHFIRGSELMGTRGENIRQKLVQLALEEERVRIEQIPLSEYHRLPALIDEFAAQIESVGLNPFKG